MTTTMTTGARLLVDALVANGTHHAFCVPGESYLAVLDALHDAPIALTVCRQEGGSAMMAEAAGKLTGRPGIAFVTRGPGATNAAAGVHVAMQDSTPMILFVGQVERAFLDREAFQEVDYVRFFSPLAKWAAEIRDPARVPEYVNRAFAVATSGRPGPVVLSLPEDMLTEATAAVPVSSFTPVAPAVGPDDLDAFARLLAEARRPIAILGGSGWTEAAWHDMRRFAESWSLPVAVSFRRQGLFDHTHPNFAGVVGIGIDGRLKARIEGADLMLLVGGRLSEMPSQSYTLLSVPNPAQRLVHVHPGPEEIGKVYRPTLGIVSGPPAFAAAAARLRPPAAIPPWTEETRAAHAEYLSFSGAEAPIPGRVQMREVMRTLAKRLPADAMIASGAGNYATWVHRFHRFARPFTQLAPTSGSMGYGLPAAIAAKRLQPERMVVCFAGDGCFLMTGQELATAAQYGIAVIVVVIDNGMYGTIRMHQERHYPGRESGSALKNPDFAALARSHGALGLTVRETTEFAPALEAAMAAGGPALIHVLIDPEAITPTLTLSQIRAAASVGKS